MDELLLRQMPHSTEAEQAVLGSMLIDARCVPQPRQELPLDSGGGVWYNIWDFSPAERPESE